MLNLPEKHMDIYYIFLCNDFVKGANHHQGKELYSER